jgi:hypothetical protein
MKGLVRSREGSIESLQRGKGLEGSLQKGLPEEKGSRRFHIESLSRKFYRKFAKKKRGPEGST